MRTNNLEILVSLLILGAYLASIPQRVVVWISVKVTNSSLFRLLVIRALQIKEKRIHNYVFLMLVHNRVAKGTFNGMLYVGVIIALFVGIFVDGLILQYLPSNLGILGAIIGFAVGALVAYYIIRIFAIPKLRPAI